MCVTPLTKMTTVAYYAGNGECSRKACFVGPDSGFLSSRPVLRTGQVVSNVLNVRSGPSTDNPKVGQLNRGDTVAIYETSADGWHRIGDGQWVLGKFVREL